MPRSLPGLTFLISPARRYPYGAGVFFRLVVLGLYTESVYPALCVLCTARPSSRLKSMVFFFDCENDIIQSLDFELLNGGIKWLEKSNLCRAIGGSCRGSRIDELYGRSEAAFLALAIGNVGSC